MAELFPAIIANRSGPPEIPDEAKELSLQDFFKALPWHRDFWDDAGMVDVLAYLRGNKIVAARKLAITVPGISVGCIGAHPTCTA